MSDQVAESSFDSSVELTAEIIAAYVAHNSVPTADLPALIASVHKALGGLSSAPAAEPEIAKPTPAVPFKRSVTPDYIICLEDGKRYKSLKRHLMTAYRMTPQQYREKWDLPKDYPMVAPTYAAQRSILAKSVGLGQKGRAASRKPRGAHQKAA